MSFRKRMSQHGSDKKLSRRHDSGKISAGNKAKFPSIVIKDKLPEGVENWWCKEGKHLVDIIPFFAGKDFPLDADETPIVEEGEMTYKLELFVHRNIGNLGKPYVCPFENFNKPCPICEFIKSNRLNREDWIKLSPKNRTFYLVWVHDTKKELEKKGVQLWEVAGFFMEEKLEEISALPHGGGYEHFWHPNTGKSVAWTRKDKGQNNTEYLGHRFIDRETPIPDRILDQSFPIDSVINMHPAYKDIERDFKGTLKKLNLIDEDEEEENPFPTVDGDINDFDDFDDFDSISEKQTEKKKLPTSKRKKVVRKRSR